MSNWIVFAGHSVLAQTFLEQCLSAHLAIRAIVRLGETDFTPTANPIALKPPPELAWRYAAQRKNIPVLYTKKLDATFIARLPECDFILNACVPLRFPPALLHHPSLAALNLHSSLLPNYRGPYPVFWQLRDGASHIGISLHVMNANWDTGPILLQNRIAIPIGARETELEKALAEVSIGLVEQLENALISTALEFPTTHAMEQGHYQPQPRVADYHVDCTWSAQHMFNFMRALEKPGRLFTLQWDDQWYYLQAALAFNPDADVQKPSIAVDGSIIVPCRHGYVRALALNKP